MEFEDAANCYVHINADVEAINLEDNAITNIKHLGPEESGPFAPSASTRSSPRQLSKATSGKVTTANQSQAGSSTSSSRNSV